MELRLTLQERAIVFAIMALGIATGFVMLHDMQIVQLEMTDIADLDVLGAVRRWF